MSARASLRIMQQGQEVAAVDGPEESAIREAMHYALMYAQDGAATKVEGRNARSKAALARYFRPPDQTP